MSPVPNTSKLVSACILYLPLNKYEITYDMCVCEVHVSWSLKKFIQNLHNTCIYRERACLLLLYGYFLVSNCEMAVLTLLDWSYFVIEHFQAFSEGTQYPFLYGSKFQILIWNLNLSVLILCWTFYLLRYIFCLLLLLDGTNNKVYPFCLMCTYGQK